MDWHWLFQSHFLDTRRAKPCPASESAGVAKCGRGKSEFEVATIRLNKPGTFIPPNFAMDSGDFYNPSDPHGRFSADFPLSVYIQFAYKLWLTNDQVHTMLANLPKWVATDSFVIRAMAPGDPTEDQMRLIS